MIPTNWPKNLVKIPDGDKEAGEQSVVLLHKGPQWVQIDLGSPYEIYAIVIWHGHDEPEGLSRRHSASGG